MYMFIYLYATYNCQPDRKEPNNLSFNKFIFTTGLLFLLHDKKTKQVQKQKEIHVVVEKVIQFVL